MRIFEDSQHRSVRSADYNYDFNKDNGFFARWGKTQGDDPDYSPFGPELIDIEISSASYNDIEYAINSDDRIFNRYILTDEGCTGKGCKAFCYKGNVSDRSIHMTIETFQQILSKLPRTVTQIAFGICGIESNPDTFKIFRASRESGIIPNVTINGIGITEEIACKLSSVCGAVAISVNPYNREEAYNAVKLLSQTYGMSQINFHIVLAEETAGFVKQVIDDIICDSRLAKLNALVMLSFKDKAETSCYTSISQTTYNKLLNYCMESGINFGFDSCSARRFMTYIQDNPNRESIEAAVEPCESGLFSIYINVHGQVFACSFCEGMGMWKTGIDLLSDSNMKDIWGYKKMKEWRVKLLKNKRCCPFYKIGEK